MPVKSTILSIHDKTAQILQVFQSHFSKVFPFDFESKPLMAPFSLDNCPSTGEMRSPIFIFPQIPTDRSPLRIVAVSKQKETNMSLELFNANGQKMTPNRQESWGYLPKAFSIYFNKLSAGNYRVRYYDNKGLNVFACHDVNVISIKKDDSTNIVPNIAGDKSWAVRNDWDAHMEDLFSVFTAKLFFVPPGSTKSWRPLHRAIQDPFRNILYGILGYDEDSADAAVPVSLSPDCADAPGQIRAYFAWKMGLPMMLNECNRGTSVNGPICFRKHSNLSQSKLSTAHPVAHFNRFAKATLGWKLHAGTFRTMPDDKESVVYPVELTPESVRPGTVFVDAEGHIILVSHWEPQTSNKIGTLFGIDAHPDKSVTHKAFSKGTFVFNSRVPTDGFKAFRPVIRDGGALRYLSNKEINERQGFPKYSSMQSKIKSTDLFYRKMFKSLNPKPIEPQKVLSAKIDVLYRAAQERVQAVQIGVDYMRRQQWGVMPMPHGPAIFQTEGPWETYSTPARDLRFFLAIDDVLNFPQEALKNSDLYKAAPNSDPQSIEKELSKQLKKGLENKTITYQRSDGTPWSISLKELVSRQTGLEMAYNPNDCPEIRWAAQKSSKEFEPCRKKAPAAQVKSMLKYRKWFTTRRRPDQR